MSPPLIEIDGLIARVKLAKGKTLADVTPRDRDAIRSLRDYLTAPLDRRHPDVIAALAAYDRARQDLGPELCGYSLVDLLADYFAAWPLEHCRAVAGLCRELRQ